MPAVERGKVTPRLIIFESSPWLRRTVLLAFWILSFLILTISYTNSKLNTLYNNAISHGRGSRLPKNQIGAISYTRWDRKENYRPIYSVGLKNLLVGNNNLGIFKTGLHKVAKIRDLQLEFHQHTAPKATLTKRLNSNKSPRTTVTDNSSILEYTITDARTIIGIVDRLVRPGHGWRVSIDLSNVSEVRVSNFDYKVFCDGSLFFSVQSKRVIASTKQSDLLLRGHVTIRTADGSTLESNCVTWDLKNQRFKVNGIYVLNRSGIRTTGKGICVDIQLNVFKEHAECERKERK